MNRPLLSSLRFGTLLAYTAHGDDELAKKSIVLRNLVKRYDSRTVTRFCEILLEHLNSRGVLSELFERDSLLLVPVPRSAPLPPGAKVTDALWPALHFCRAIKDCGINCSIEPCLERKTKVHKSAFAGPGERPNPEEHCASMQVSSANILMRNYVLLVDDFITRGSTMLGAASLLAETYPNLTINGFSVVRSVYPKDLKALVDPYIGEIRYENGHLTRQP